MHLYRLAWLSGWLLASMATSHAQDITLSGARWMDPLDPPQVLPTMKGAATLTVPAELQATTEIGYLEFDVLLDPEGKALWSATRTSHPELEKVIESGRSAWKYTPALRNRAGVNSRVAWTLLFNPASAAPGLADATPRLLAAEPVALSRSPTDKPLYVDLLLDETGQIKGVKGIPAEAAPRIIGLLNNWKFAPARKGGQPVAAEVRVPLVVAAKDLYFRISELSQIPKPRTRVPPRYPFEMRKNGIAGEVLVQFIIDLEGRIKNATAVRSTRPEFEQAAVEAVVQWKFQPGSKDGRLVNTLMQVPIVFSLNE